MTTTKNLDLFAKATNTQRVKDFFTERVPLSIECGHLSLCNPFNRDVLDIGLRVKPGIWQANSFRQMTDEQWYIRLQKYYHMHHAYNLSKNIYIVHDTYVGEDRFANENIDDTFKNSQNTLSQCIPHSEIFGVFDKKYRLNSRVEITNIAYDLIYSLNKNKGFIKVFDSGCIWRVNPSGEIKVMTIKNDMQQTIAAKIEISELKLEPIERFVVRFVDNISGIASITFN